MSLTLEHGTCSNQDFFRGYLANLRDFFKLKALKEFAKNNYANFFGLKLLDSDL